MNDWQARRDSTNEVSHGHEYGQPYSRIATPETGRGGVWPSPPHLECGDRRFESCRPDQTHPATATLDDPVSSSGRIADFDSADFGSNPKAGAIHA